MGGWRTYLLAEMFRVARHPAPGRLAGSGGFTLVELVLAVAIVGILSSMAIPNYLGFLEKARVARTVAEMNAIAKDIQGHAIGGPYPDNLAQIGWNQRLDPWGNPYQYFRINCGAVIIGRLDNHKSPTGGSAGPVLPVSVILPPVGAHASFAVDKSNHHEARIYLIQASAPPGGGAGGPPGGGAGGPPGGGGGGPPGGGGGGPPGGGGGGPPGGGGGGPPCGNIGQARKDRFLVPINSDFDLYSMGKDGRSVGPLTAQQSHDDIIRANDGGYYGLASNF
jgi:general secretion pathway protein G